MNTSKKDDISKKDDTSSLMQFFKVTFDNWMKQNQNVLTLVSDLSLQEAQTKQWRETAMKKAEVIMEFCKKNNELTETIRDSKEQYDELTKKMQNLKEQYDELLDRYKKLLSDHDNDTLLEKEYNDLELFYDSLKQNYYDELEKEHKDMKEKHIKLEEKYRNLQEQTEEDLEQLQTKHDNLKKQYYEDKCKLKKKCDKLKTKCAKTLAEHNKSLADIQETLQNRKNEYQNLKQTKEELQEKYNAKQEDYKQLEEEYNKQSIQLSKSHAAIDRLDKWNRVQQLEKMIQTIANTLPIKQRCARCSRFIFGQESDGYCDECARCLTVHFHKIVVQMVTVEDIKSHTGLGLVDFQTANPMSCNEHMTIYELVNRFKKEKNIKDDLCLWNCRDMTKKYAEDSLLLLKDLIQDDKQSLRFFAERQPVRDNNKPDIVFVKRFEDNTLKLLHICRVNITSDNSIDLGIQGHPSDECLYMESDVRSKIKNYTIFSYFGIKSGDVLIFCSPDQHNALDTHLANLRIEKIQKDKGFDWQVNPEWTYVDNYGIKKSKPFVIEGYNMIWNVLFKPKGLEPKYVNNMSCFLGLYLEGQHGHVKCKFKIILCHPKSHEKNIVRARMTPKILNKSNPDWGFNDFVEITQKQEYLYPDGKLHIRIEFIE